MRPGDLGDPHLVDSRTDEYLLMLIKNGGATIGKPGMPAFGYHLTEEQIRDVVRYLRTLSRSEKPVKQSGARRP
jgi:mono/diheme cytochrome c family protein